MDLLVGKAFLVVVEVVRIAAGDMDAGKRRTDDVYVDTAPSVAGLG